MRNSLVLFSLFLATTLPAQFSVYLEQGVGFSDEVHHQPIGLGVDYQVTKNKGFNLIVGLAYNQMTLEEELILQAEPFLCGTAGCIPPPVSFVKSYESRLALPFGVSHTSNRFTYGLQVRPGHRFGSRIRTINPPSGQPVEARFGEDLPLSSLFSDQATYRVDKSRFSLQIGTDLRYAISSRISVGLNYRFEGFLKEDIFLFRALTFSSTPGETEYYRGQAQAHYLVATVGWRW